jgi:uncharacterized repeat protein (TIGR03803 family)
MTNSARLSRPSLQISLQWMASSLLVVGVLAVITTSAAQAQTLTTLHSFSANGGSNPWTGVTPDAAGNFYGTTAYGGSPNCGSGCGTVFKLTHRSGGWVLTTIYEFQGGSDGGQPRAGLTIGPDGTLYGTTDWTYGTVFNLRPPDHVCGSVSCPWTKTVLYSFTGGNDGGPPGYGNLIFDQQGNLYGTTGNGGARAAGTVFELTRSGGGWTKSVLYSFPDDQYLQCNPRGGVVFDRSGNLWGTAMGCSNSYGAVFKLSLSGSGWTASVIHVFQDTLYGSTPDGAFPSAPLAQDSAGNFYGTTMEGPPNPVCPDLGTVFKVNAAGEFSTLHFFPSGSGPECAEETGLMGPVSLDAQGNLYGTQYANGYGGYGGVFKGGPLGWSQLANFPVDSGGLPIGSVVLDANGNVYGTASENGPGGGGTVWEITP